MQCIYRIGTMSSSHLGIRKKLKIFYELYFPGKDKWIFSPSLWLRRLYKPSFYWPLPIIAGSSCDAFLKPLSHTTETARNNLHENSLHRYLLFCLCVYTLIELTFLIHLPIPSKKHWTASLTYIYTPLNGLFSTDFAQFFLPSCLSASISEYYII